MLKPFDVPAKYQKYIIAFFMDLTLTIIFGISAYASAFYGFETLNNVSLFLLAGINVAFVVFVFPFMKYDADF